MSHESSASSATFGNSGQGFIHVSHGAESSTSKPPRPVNQNTDEIPQVVPVGTVRPERVVSRVQQALTDYREGRIGKGYAISIFTKALDFDANGTDASKEAALQDYIQQLAAFDEDNRDSDSTHSDDEGQYEDTTRRTAEVSNPHLKAAAIENHNKNVHGRKGKGKKLARRERDDGGSSGGDSSSSDSSSDDGSDEKDKHKSKKVKLTDMPWYEEEKTAITTARPSCTKSTELLETYARDYKKVKRWLETSQVAQESFPSSEWDNIIRGKAVNLDVVLSSTFHLVAVKENVGRIGDRSISLGTTEPARKVANHGDWTIAWNRASAAVTFAFPHRQKELRAYGEFIQGEFSARVPEAHARVIRYRSLPTSARSHPIRRRALCFNVAILRPTQRTCQSNRDL
ncbi:hypothetical protein BKA70DRAFT_1349141 [Coprinopsis sp. MPI-PUGE-AT-0042]|nr:hypothetical protein BKA70DRAFT_1349141 [Coprinopsis sp. MPI-PUGE-AT-0042]